MSAVFVLDAERRPLAPVHPGRARLLLKAGQAAVFKRYPFTIILKRSVAAIPVEDRSGEQDHRAGARG